MSARLAPPASIAAPPAPWATLADALLAEQLAQLARHEYFPMPGILQVARWQPVEPALFADLRARRREG